MTYIYSKDIIDFFNILNESSIDYILLRNINNEIPFSLQNKKDIDILVKYEDRYKIYKFFVDNNFKQIPHPNNNDIYLYGTKKFEFFKNDKNIIVDLNFHLMCRSLDDGQWIPLDQTVQESAWDNKRLIDNESLQYWSLSIEDEFISLVVRSVFDKKEFLDGYVKRISELYKNIDIDDVNKKFNLIFFKYTPYLLEKIRNNEYQYIIKNYIQFKEY